MSLLALSDVNVTTEAGGRQIDVLRDVSLAVGRGELVGVVGESGAGKSMVGRLIAGMLPRGFAAGRGSVTFRDRDLLDMPPRERTGLLGDAIAFVPQHPMTSLNPVLSLGAQFDEHLRRLGQDGKGGAARTGGRRARLGPPAAPGRSARPLSAPAFRRPVPAGADRHGLRGQARPDYRRRADHGARRHHPGPGHGTDRRIAARQRDRPAVHHPRSAAGRGALPADRRDVCRGNRRDRPGPRRCSAIRCTRIPAAWSPPIPASAGRSAG